VRNQSSVCVIGFELAQRLFQRQKPLAIDSSSRIDEQTFSCVVIGVAKPTFSKARAAIQTSSDLPYTYFDSLPFYWYYHQFAA